MLSNIDEKENLARMEQGELYYAFSPELIAARKRCGRIVGQLNRAGELSRRELAVYWKEYVVNLHGLRYECKERAFVKLVKESFPDWVR